VSLDGGSVAVEEAGEPAVALMLAAAERAALYASCAEDVAARAIQARNPMNIHL
jgi:hypothetical protein